jgi:purine nucleosidase
VEFRPPRGPRLRVISDNDYAGDPDGLYQLVHLLLSPSVDVRGVVGSHLAPGDVFDASEHTADHALREIRTVLDLLGRDAEAVAGSNRGLADTRTPAPSRGAELIVREAMRTDTDLPLYVTLGAGLTELASAYLMEPAIAGRLTAVWIGGPEHPGLGAPAFAGSDPEYNLNIDVAAARVVFNDSDIDLWQVPRDAYRQCLASMTELAARVAPMGRVGRHLYDALVAVAERESRNLGETYVLGDNPLVLLTALQSSFEPDTTSSRYVVLPCPRIGEDGAYEPAPDGRDIRVYTWLDVRLMLEDFFLKLSRRG